MDRKPLVLALVSLAMPVFFASAQTSPTDNQQLNSRSTRTSSAIKGNVAGDAASGQAAEVRIPAVSSIPAASLPVSIGVKPASQEDASNASADEVQLGGVASFQAVAGASPRSMVSSVPSVSSVASVPAQKTGSAIAISQRSPVVQSQISVQSSGTGNSPTVVPTENQQFTTASTSCGNISLGVNGALNGFVPSPNDPWHVDVTNAAVDPSSANMTLNNAADLAYHHLHPDFGSTWGIPYNVVDSSIPGLQTQFQMPMTYYPDDSDLTYYPVKVGMAIEDAPGDCQVPTEDQHMIVIDRHSCTDYETWLTIPCQGSFTSANGLLFDLLNTEQRPYGLTSADASGLSVFEGLIRYDEIVAGSINHAIRFTMPFTKNDQNGGYFVAPATHAAGTNWGTDLIMGTRIRLKASFDVSGFSPTNQIILNAMKKYGMILVDNGSGIYFQGTPDPRWNDDDLSQLSSIYASSFDVISLPPAYDSNSAPTGAAPVISSFTASPTTSAGKTYYILKANITGASYSFMDQPGVNNGVMFRGFMAVQPTKTTTYTLTSRNVYGTTQAKVTVTVK